MFDEWRATDPGAEGSTEQVVTVPGRPDEFADAGAVEYTTTFSDPREPSDEIAVLELRGLYAHSEVTLNGDVLDGDGTIEHDAYFRPLRIPFEPQETNELTVTCFEPEDRFGGIHDTDLVPDEQAVPGIWWGASLESHPLPYIDRIDVKPTVSGEGVELDVRTAVVTDGPIDERITYSIRPAGDTKSRGMMQRGGAETDSGGRTVLEHTVDVHDPELWWPRGLGDQHQYTLRAKLDGTEHAVTTGICDIEREGGQLLVNGQPMSIRGVNLLTAEEADVDRALECNANLVRAHAQVLPDELYERCVEEGVLVWQDLPLTGAGAFETDRAVELATALDRQYSRYPCLAACTVHDDPVDPFATGLGSGTLDRLRFRYRAWRASYDADDAETVADSLPDHRPTLPVVGPPGIGAEAGSYYPGWSYGKAADIDSLLEQYPVPIVAEYGAASIATERNRETDAACGFDSEKHDRQVSGDVADSQRYQGNVVRTITETLRRERTGAIAFALRDTDAAGMGVYTADGEPKHAFDTLSEGFQPIQLFVNEPTAAESEVTVINDTPRAFSATLSWSAGDASGTLDLTVGEQGRWIGGPIELPPTAPQATLELEMSDRTVTNSYELP